MTPRQLYDEIEPVLTAFQLAGLEIADIGIGNENCENDESGESDDYTGVGFSVYKGGYEICFVLHPPESISDKYVSICSPYQDKAWIKRHINSTPRFLAKELSKIL